MNKYIIAVTLLFTGLLSAQQSEKQQGALDSIQKLDEIIISTNVIFGNKYVAKHRTGSAYYLSSKELEKFSFTDVNSSFKMQFLE